jgi:hypothetical protein
MPRGTLLECALSGIDNVSANLLPLPLPVQFPYTSFAQCYFHQRALLFIVFFVGKWQLKCHQLLLFPRSGPSINVAFIIPSSVS